MMDERQEEFARSLYFDMQRIDGMDPLEIWNGVMEFDEPYEKTGLIKNLFKVVIPLVNEALYGRPFGEHSALVKKSVTGLLAVLGAKAPELAERFLDPPTRDAERKELYEVTRDEAARVVAPLAKVMRAAEARAGKADLKARSRKPQKGRKVRPVDQSIESIFDFTEMRINDNELPYIIFTDKEYWVIHGLVMVYLWLIDLDSLFISVLEENGIAAEIVNGYLGMMRKVHKENPLVIQGREMDPKELYGLIQEKMKGTDYLDVFEDAYKWFDAVRQKLQPK